MRKFYLLLLLCSVFTVTAQTNLFKIQYHEPTEVSDAVAHTATMDGGSIMASVQHPSLTVNYSISVIKTDASGSIQWTRKFATGRPGFRNIVQSPDGSYFLCYSEFPMGNYYEAIRMDVNGNVLYDKRISLPSNRRVGWQCINVAKRDSGYYVGCVTTDTLTGVAQWNVFEMTASGNVVWSRDFYPDAFRGALVGMQLCNNNDLLLLGATYDIPSQAYQGLVARITSAGNPVWATRFGYAGHDMYAVDAVPNGSGFFISTQDYDQNAGLAAVDFVGMDSLGTLTWGMRYTPNTNSILPYDLIAAGNNEFAIVGLQSGPQMGSVFLKVDGSGQYSSSRFYPKFTVMSIERHNPWQFSCAATRDSLNEHYMTLFTTDLDGRGCDDTTAVFGQGPISFTSGSVSNYFSGILNPVSGNLTSLTMVVVPGVLCSVTSTAENHAGGSAVSVYPVPATNQLNVQSDEVILLTEITDVTGKVVMRINPNASTFSIDISKLPSGVYTSTFCSEKQQYRRKFIRE